MDVVLITAQFAAHNSRIGRIAQALRRGGHSITLMSPDEEAAFPHAIRELGMEHIQVDRLRPRPVGVAAFDQISNGLAFRLFQTQVLRHSRAREACLFVLDTDALAAVRPILASGSSCVVFDACEYFLDTAVTDAGSRAYVHELLRVTVPHLRAVTCVNSAIEQCYRQALPSFPPTIIIGNTTTLHRTTKRDASPLRLAARAAATDYLALFHGGFSARRGLNQLAIAARDLQPPWRIVLLGAGPLQQSLERMAARAPQLTILPRVGLEALAEWLCGADLGLIPYEAGPVNHDLATPNKLYEFPAVGVPLAVTDLQLVSEIVRGNDLGVVFRDAAFATELVAWMNSGAAAQYVAPDQAKAQALAGFVASNHWHQDERRLVDLFANLERYPAKAR